jgi:superfamily II DNA/RNA helicase
VAHVVNYDAPVDMRKYVHRVGRTARAGRIGDAWTLIEEQEVVHHDVVDWQRLTAIRLGTLLQGHGQGRRSRPRNKQAEGK